MHYFDGVRLQILPSSALLLIAIACGLELAMGWIASGADAALIQLLPLLHPDLYSIPPSAWTAAIIPGLSSQFPFLYRNTLQKNCSTERDISKAHEWWTRYMGLGLWKRREKRRWKWKIGKRAQTQYTMPGLCAISLTGKTVTKIGYIYVKQ